ncbi:MAG: hypothetical protein QM731_25395 [Chitinophagaceae bacterium]
MKKQMHQFGKSLSREQLKGIIGGQPPKTLWRCLIEPGYYDNVCRTSQPQVPCNYSEPCTEIGTCTSRYDVCIS